MFDMQGIYNKEILSNIVAVLFINAIVLFVYWYFVNIFSLEIYGHIGFPSEMGGLFTLADYILQGKDNVINSSFRPPGVVLWILLLKIITFNTLTTLAYILISVNLIIILLFLIMRCFVIRDSLIIFIITVIFLHPYLIWNLIISRDTAAEFVFYLAFLYLVLITLVKKKQSFKFILLISIFALFAGLMRTTNFYITGMTLFILILFYKEYRKFWLYTFVLSITLFMLFMGYNKIKFNTFSLATSGTVNIYEGNHPYFLYMYPKYDAETFWHNRSDWYIDTDSMSDIEKKDIWLEKGLEFIKDDPIRFVYNVFTKSYMHWFNLEKIPNYSQQVHLSKDGKSIENINPSMSLSRMVIYIIYKFFYLIFFVGGLIYFLFYKFDKKILIMYMPYIALWPIVVIAHPDTRFKMIAEIVAIIPSIIIFIDFIKEKYKFPNNKSLLKNILKNPYQP